MICTFVSDAYPFVVLGLGPIAVGYPKDDNAHCTKEYNKKSINTAQSASREIRRTWDQARADSLWARPTSSIASTWAPPLGILEVIDASTGADDRLEHAPACLELIGVLEEDKDVLPSSEIAGHHRSSGGACSSRSHSSC